MNIDRLLAFIIVGLTALLIGGMAGLWLGAATEHDALAKILARADLTANCQAKIENTMVGGIAPDQPAQ